MLHHCYIITDETLHLVSSVLVGLSLPALLELLILQLGGLKEHDNVCTGKNYPLLLARAHGCRISLQLLFDSLTKGQGKLGYWL